MEKWHVICLVPTNTLNLGRGKKVEEGGVSDNAKSQKLMK